MKTWLKENWFKLGLLFTSLLIVFMGTFIILSIPIQKQTNQKLDNGFQETQNLVPIVKNNIPQEDPLVKIERCKIDAQQEAERAGAEFVRKTLQNAGGLCGKDPNCNPENSILFLGKVRENVEKSRYDSIYGVCLSANTKEEFYAELQKMRKAEEYCNSISGLTDDELAKCYSSNL